MFSKEEYKRRKEAILKYTASYLSTSIIDAFYFTGFKGDTSITLISPQKNFLITDQRFETQVKEEVIEDTEVIILKPGEKYSQKVIEILKDERINEVYLSGDIKLSLLPSFLGNSVEFKTSEKYKIFEIKEENIRFIISGMDISKEVRKIKSKEEIKVIKENIRLTEEGYVYITGGESWVGKKEKEIALELEYYLRYKGAERMGFDTIVASGYRSAMPHGSATEKLINKDEIIILDFGIVKNFYHTDITRVVSTTSNIPEILKNAYKYIIEAIEDVFTIIKPGIKASELHKRVVEIFKKYGVEEFFKHSTGHGVGLEIHELPSISSTSEDILEKGMIFTIEPGLYFEGIGGIRIEEMVLVTSKGAELLTTIPREILKC